LEILTAARVITSVILIGLSGTCFADGVQTPQTHDNEILRLPPYRVTGGFFDFIVRKKAGTEFMRDAKVTWVSPQIYQFGLRRGDAMESIDGRPIDGMASLEFLELLNRNPTIMNNTVFEFIGHRYLYLVTAHITLIFSPPRTKIPNQTSELKPSLYRPPVGQGSSHP
jgi:hypothetical protein